MDYIVPSNDYIIVTPKGEIKGFKDLDKAQNYIDFYNSERLRCMKDKPDYRDYDMTDINSSIDIFTRLGVDEGECLIYDLQEFIQRIQESSFFDEEKEELIKKLLKDEIDLNVKDYQIETILNEVNIVMY
ncbi:hypothetical protein [Clostridium tarantellae]|uniref:Uncharacterized protein n=1 Tax=Clostridium tarantellae TaxID=39493 RepID=A0A6I1MQ37_9CLOT|nr:hypothetical protein [Clostridium tarantellae]MPQ44352.1 hypothetical protein [Clostridium tarantellae]